MSRNILLTTIISLLTLTIFSCSGDKSDDKKKSEMEKKILFLHHSTGERIWYGNRSSIKAIFHRKFLKESAVSYWFRNYNKQHNTNYLIIEQDFPKRKPYGWNNYPFDYYTIWVKNAGPEPYLEEPTLEILTKDYDVIIWKHCFPVGDLMEDTGIPDINSEEKRVENYKLQYIALREKMHEFPNTKFLVWTGAALLKANTTEEKAIRTKQFFDWVRNEWDIHGDNVFIWDFYHWETEGDNYMKVKNAISNADSHPNNEFAGKVFPYLCARIVDIIESNGENTRITGEIKQAN